MSDFVSLTDYGPIDGLNYSFAWEGDCLQAYLISDVGKKRKNNEDSCIMCAPEDEALAMRRGLLFAVADGMGGASAGEYASRMALSVLARTYFDNGDKTVPFALQEAVETANEKIFEESEINPLYSGMGTTISALLLLGRWAYVAQVGDSRVYLLRERSGIHQLTRDHSLVAEQVRSGLISEEEARSHSLRNLITRAVGIKETVAVDNFAVEVQQGDTLLVCSDGLSGLVTDEAMADTLAKGSIEEGSKALIAQALENGGSDNVTAVIVRVTANPPATEFQQGPEIVNLNSSGFFRKLRKLFA